LGKVRSIFGRFASGQDDYGNTNQIISTVVNQNDLIAPYKSYNPKHPSILWANESLTNIKNLAIYNSFLCDEYTRRFGKIHKGSFILDKLELLIEDLPIEDLGATPLKLVMPEEFRSGDPVASYRRFYASKEKVRYNYTKIPTWYLELKSQIIP
jgi:hypothetical protein